jgi:transcriptional regulator with PAS, ATPase and Fis domain
LITGESGTGKELIAAAIHRLGRRSTGPYVPVNISALPDGLVEGELFGYVKGAFTGATQDRKGRFEAANGGTLFVDEIGDFPLALQPKLLRVLEGFIVCPVGSNLEKRVDVRVIAATSRNLNELVAAGTFRDDLYYRLNVLTIHVPPLRERREDIPMLIRRFLEESARRHAHGTPLLAPELVNFLENYDWPGNVRQLRNAIENMVVMGREKTLNLGDLPRYLSGGPIAQGLGTSTEGILQDLERVAILSALDRFQGNRTRTAEALGISVRTLQRKLKQWGIAATDSSSGAGPISNS